MNKPLCLLKLSFVFLLISGCSPFTIKQDYDRDADFSKYKTYRWSVAQTDKKDPVTNSTLLAKRIKSAVDRKLASQGYVRREENPDMLLAYHIKTKEKYNVHDYGFGWRPGYWWGGYGGRNVDVYNYTEGTLIIDVVDRQEKQIVWRGWAVGVTGRPSESQQRIDRAVEGILKTFPPISQTIDK